nr:ORF4 [Epsilontorquevirus sp.]
MPHQRASTSSTGASGAGEGTCPDRNPSRIPVISRGGAPSPSPVMTRREYYSKIQRRPNPKTSYTRETSDGETSPSALLNALPGLTPQTPPVPRRSHGEGRRQKRTPNRWSPKTSTSISRGRRRLRSRREKTEESSSSRSSTERTRPLHSKNTKASWKRCTTRGRRRESTGRSSRSSSSDSWTDISSTDYSLGDSPPQKRNKVGGLGRGTRFL